jgi:hypothetical protein
VPIEGPGDPANQAVDLNDLLTDLPADGRAPNRQLEPQHWSVMWRRLADMLSDIDTGNPNRRRTL